MNEVFGKDDCCIFTNEETNRASMILIIALIDSIWTPTVWNLFQA